MQLLKFDLYGFGASAATKTWMLQRTYNWQLVLPHTIGGISGFLVSQYCQEVRFGDYTIADVSALRYGPEQRFYPGLFSIDTVTLIFLKSVDNSVLTYFYKWHELVVDKSGYYYPKNHYKKDFYVFLYDKTGLESTKFTLKGAFPKRRPSYSLSYGEENVLRIEVELCVDKMELGGGLLESLVEGVRGILS